MNVTQIVLNDDELPARLTAELPMTEAAFLARVVGAMTPAEAEAVMPGGGAALNQVYECLSSLFNRFYDDGVNEAIATR
ncbi:hypothetical protein [Streptomyces sp. NPDC059063]|uniref:hypothetical protein n=1 Tax=Streptomyces sp. NPDC059063 TaxID=3346712 RepID=UPI0036CD2478